MSFYWDKLWYEVQQMIGIINMQESPDDFRRISTIIESGYKQFIYPPPVHQTKGRAHVWSFLRPIEDITTSEDDQYADLPDDFASMNTNMTYTGERYKSVEYVSVERMRKLKQAFDRTGRPQYFALSIDQSGTQRIWMWPTPDAEYDLAYQYERIPDVALDDIHSGDGTLTVGSDTTIVIEEDQTGDISIGDIVRVTQDSLHVLCEVLNIEGATNTLTIAGNANLESGDAQYSVYPENPVVLCREPYHEVVLASVLSIAEQRVEEMPGQHMQRFLEILLPAAISRDQTANAPRRLGGEFESGMMIGRTPERVLWNGVEII